MNKIVKRSLLAGAVVIIGIVMFIGYQYILYHRIIAIDKNCSVILDDAGNSVLLTSENGKQALLIDTKQGKTAEKCAKQLRKYDLTIVNTHAHRDHTSGNRFFGTVPIIGGDVPPAIWASESENSTYPTITLKAEEEKVMTIGTETVRIRNTGRGHTGNDLVVYLVNRRLLVAGDLLFPKIHPVLFPTSGGNTTSWVKTLDSLNAVTVIDKVIPGHGLPSDRTGLTAQRDYFTSITGAIGNKDKLDELKKRFGGFYAVPGLSSFDKTVAFIARERGLN